MSPDPAVNAARWSFVAAAASVLATVIVGGMSFRTSKQSLTHAVVMSYFDANLTSKLTFPPTDPEEMKDVGRFIVRLEYIAELINQGAIDPAIVPTTIKCNMLIAEQMGYRDPYNATTSTAALREFLKHYRVGCGSGSVKFSK